MKKNLLIDIDGIACDHAKSICERVNADFGLTANPNEIVTWDHKFGPITFVQAVAKYYPDCDFIKSMKVSKGFFEFYESVKGIVNITFATAREHSREATTNWIACNFPGETVVFTKNKALVKGQDILIDDYYGECIASAKTGVSCILFSRPWNNTPEIFKSISKYKNIAYCQSFEEAFLRIQAITGIK